MIKRDYRQYLMFWWFCVFTMIETPNRFLGGPKCIFCEKCSPLSSNIPVKVSDCGRYFYYSQELICCTYGNDLGWEEEHCKWI